MKKNGGSVVRRVPFQRVQSLIRAHIGACQVRQAVKARKGNQPDTLHFYPIPEYPFSSVAVDFCHLPEVRHRDNKLYNSVFVVVCRLTGYIQAIPCNENITSDQLASLFLDRVVSLISLPKEIFSDNNKLVDADFFRTVCELSGIEQWKSPVYRPQSNGRAERAVQVVVNSLRTFLEQVSSQVGKHKRT